jgi:peptide chain release factor subunit 1
VIAGSPTIDRVRELSRFRSTSGEGVLSVYLSLDPSEYAVPKARMAEIESLADEARKRYTDDEEHRPLELDSPVARSVERTRSYLEGDFAPEGALGVAAFAAEDPKLFAVLRLHYAVQSRIMLDERPFVSPLLAGPPSLDGWFVLMVNRRTARLLAGHGGDLEEVAGFIDAVHGRHDQGGWSQPRYQRHIEKQVKDHVQRACRALFEHSRREPVEKVVLATIEEVGPLVEESLHPDLARRLAGRVVADIEAARPEDLAPQVMEIAVRDRERSDDELLDRLGAGLARGERAVSGVGPVLDALTLGGVAVLLACPDLSGTAVSCPSCGWLGLEGSECPIDGKRTRARQDVLEAAVEAALDQAADVRLLDRREIRDGGCVAALLRFDAG